MSFSVVGLTEELAGTLSEITRASAGLRDPWWIIGSAALALVGLPGVVVPDVDLVTSRRDAERLIRKWTGSADPLPAVPSTQFRSEFRRFRHAPLPLEVMGDFDVWTGSDWYPVRPRTRVRVACGSGDVYVAAADEQVEILRRIGRPKDLARAKALEAFRRRSETTIAVPALVNPSAALVPEAVAANSGEWAASPLNVPAGLLAGPVSDAACLLSA